MSPRYVIHDRDAKFPPGFDTVFTAEGAEVIRTPYRAPNANAYAERWVRSARAECLDHILIVGEAHLRRVLSEYVTDFNRSRSHQGINQRVPDRESNPDIAAATAEQIVSFPVLGGLHHEYRRVA